MTAFLVILSSLLLASLLGLLLALGASSFSLDFGINFYFLTTSWLLLHCVITRTWCVSDFIRNKRMSLMINLQIWIFLLQAYGRLHIINIIKIWRCVDQNLGFFRWIIGFVFTSLHIKDVSFFFTLIIRTYIQINHNFITLLSILLGYSCVNSFALISLHTWYKISTYSIKYWWLLII